ncbi:phage tail tape measure protein [Escherichia coli]|uniref:phage tail tape measure protein n=2 Tax=Escherichia coli TaxID=562 RepID=UPI000BAA9812|nr:phage tail tape measure protein [Escherichia coli]EED1494323.1 phage tail tape measure protein [Escherichia coli]EER0020131.1 phage tail tape measure protein [Escherichia coli]EER3221974.1 phage tail tape measure protein [Escherichia coli]EER3262884.1 phage tail tape measure protein [Escherichia coli]EER3307707.1 phage tail tape measure protein [Escherichia coli]
MSDNNLRLQVILNAVDKLTRPFRSAQASSRELAAAVKKSRDAIKQLDQAGSSLDSFRKLQAENQKLGDRLSYARQRANLLSQELGAMGPPSQRQVVALGRQRLAVQRLEERQKKLQQQTALVRAELYRAGISANDGASATARITRETMRYNRQLSEQEARLRRVGEQQRKMHAARGAYARRLEVRDRIAGAGATTTAAGLAMGAPVMAAVKSYTSMEDAMKGVAKQVNGLRDDNGNRTARFYEMQDAIKAASEQLPMENGAVDFAALVEGGARMNVANPDDSWEDQKRDLLAFASTAAKAATAFELPADELSESLGKIAQLYKIPTRNIEQLGDALNYLDDNAMSKGADIIDVMQRLGGVADRLDYRKAAALGSTFLTLGAAPEVAASAANAMVRELSIATMQSKSFFEGMNLLKLNPEVIEKQMTKDAMGTIQRVLEKVNALPQDKRLSAMTMLFGKEFGDDAAKLANNLPELQRQLKLTAGNDALGSMQKESDINKDSLSAQWLLVKTGVTNTFSSLGETLRAPLMEIMEAVRRVTGVMRRWVEANPELAGRLMKIAAVVASVTLALGTLAIAMAAILGPLALLRFGMKTLALTGLGRLSPLLGRLGQAFTSFAPGLFQSGDALKKLFGLFSGNEAGETVNWISRIREALSGGGDDDGGGILDAFRDGALDKIKEHARQAGETLVSSFRNPGEAVRLLGTKIRGLASAAFAPLVTSVRGAGGVIRWLVMSPFALLRAALVGVGSVLGVLLSPIGLVVAALAGVALVVWKYWQPISAFLGGVVEGFKAAAGPISAAFEPLRPVFQWIGDKVQALWGWFTDLLSPVKSTSEELNSAAAMGRRFGEALAEGLNMVMHPLESLKSGVSWLLDKLGIVSKEAAKAKLPESVTRQQPATVNADGKVMMPSGGFPSWGYGFAGMYDSGGYIPRGQFGIVGENGPEIVNGPANVTSRRNTAALAAVVAGMMGVAAAPAELPPLHPLALPAKGGEAIVSRAATVPLVQRIEAPTQIIIQTQPGQSAQDIAREVARQLDERERRLKAKARSNYSDQGGYDA